MDEDRVVLMTLSAVVLSLLGGALVMASNDRTNHLQAVAECEHNGGVLVRTTCIDKSVVIEME